MRTRPDGRQPGKFGIAGRIFQDFACNTKVALVLFPCNDEKLFPKQNKMAVPAIGKSNQTNGNPYQRAARPISAGRVTMPRQSSRSCCKAKTEPDKIGPRRRPDGAGNSTLKTRTRKTMNTKPTTPPAVRDYLAQIGKLGGQSKSPAKLAAIAQNAKKGGWPKGRPRKAR